MVAMAMGQIRDRGRLVFSAVSLNDDQFYWHSAGLVGALQSETVADDEVDDPTASRRKSAF